jgi:hypothetical protein
MGQPSIEFPVIFENCEELEEVEVEVEEVEVEEGPCATGHAGGTCGFDGISAGGGAFVGGEIIG